MNLFKQVALGIIITLSQSIFADTCYDHEHNFVRNCGWLKSIYDDSCTYTYKNFQGWVVNLGIGNLDKDSQLVLGNMWFISASFSPATGLLHCTYNGDLPTANESHPRR